MLSRFPSGLPARTVQSARRTDLLIDPPWLIYPCELTLEDELLDELSAEDELLSADDCEELLELLDEDDMATLLDEEDRATLEDDDELLLDEL